MSGRIRVAIFLDLQARQCRCYAAEETRSLLPRVDRVEYLEEAVLNLLQATISHQGVQMLRDSFRLDEQSRENLRDPRLGDLRSLNLGTLPLQTLRRTTNCRLYHHYKQTGRNE